MVFCVICSFHQFQCLQHVDMGQHFVSEHTRELENLQVFSLNLLVALFAVLAISGSKRLQTVVLALVIYTISLRVALHTCFLQKHPTLSLWLHAVPLLTISCMAGVELVLDAQSPAIAVIILVLSVLPLVTLILHHGRYCGPEASTALPIRVQEPPAIMLNSLNATSD